jgi:hypothetical protein
MGTPGLLFDRAAAERFVTHQELEPVRKFFVDRKPALTLEVVLRFRGFSRATLKLNADNYGVYFVNTDAPVPFLWLGMAWRLTDPPGTLPSWGASLEVNGPYLDRFDEGAGGLRAACERLAAAGEELGLHRFERHVELACWRSCAFVLGESDQAAAIEKLWAGYLARLADGGIPGAVRAFNEACGFR